MTAVTFRPGEEEAVPPSRSRRGFMLPVSSAETRGTRNRPARKAPTSAAGIPSVVFSPPSRAKLRSGVFPDGWERSAPRSFKTPWPAPEAGSKAGRRPTIMRTWGQLPRRTTPSRGPGKHGQPQPSPPQADRTPHPSAETRGTRNHPARKAPTSSAGLPSAALPPPPENANCACRFSPGPRVPPFTVAAARFFAV